jgi:hypothetical protein
MSRVAENEFQGVADLRVVIDNAKAHQKADSTVE